VPPEDFAATGAAFFMVAADRAVPTASGKRQKAKKKTRNFFIFSCPPIISENKLQIKLFHNRLGDMAKNERSFIIFSKHRRWTRLWQFFFTGWGLVMVAALVAGALFTKQLLWAPISAINMKEIASNQFKMSNAVFAGTDKNGGPFKIHAASARQEYDNPDTIFAANVSGTTVRISNGHKITDNFAAKTGIYSRKSRAITLRGNVRVNSSNGDKVSTDELEIQL
jgi:hypothetical protein